MVVSKAGQWAFYDVDGNRVPSRSGRAAFKARAITKAPEDHYVSLGSVEFTAHSIRRPDLHRTFKSFSRMQAWFKEIDSLIAKSMGKKR